MTMTEFAEQGHQPPDDSRASRDAASPARRDAAGPARPDMPVRVRIVWDAGIPAPVARGLGQAERDLFLSLVSPDPGARKERDVTLSAGNGIALDGPERLQIAVGNFADAISVLLCRALYPEPFPPVKMPRPHHNMGPFGSP